jgi:predicted thioesterase
VSNSDFDIRGADMDISIPPEASSRQSEAITESHSARNVGSGSVDVLATPMMIALMEAAALDAVQSYLPEGWTTVGTRVECEHSRATALGDRISATATLIKQEGRTLYFSVEAEDSLGIIGKGFHQRFIIDIDKFMKKLAKM